MIRFADEAVITVSSGKGGNGCAAFRREKYVPNGGPSGGDGGRGGDLVFEIRENLRTLSHLRHKQTFKAKNGLDGQGNRRFGADGADCVVPLPPGCVLKDAETGKVLLDFGDERSGRFVFLKGGNGGWGNCHFKGPVNQAPRTALAGQPGECLKVKVELNIIADIGFVGFPNAGKSTLLDCFTNASPEIAAYPFTTKIPNLGVLRIGSPTSPRDIVLADIPGIIEGASVGAGLGTRFLKHISRTAALAFIIDLSDAACAAAYPALLKELKAFSSELALKKRIVVGTKLDLPGTSERLAELRQAVRDISPEADVLAVSVLGRRGLSELKDAFASLVANAEAAPSEDDRAGDNSKSRGMAENAPVPAFMQAELEDIDYPDYGPEYFGATVSLSRKRRGKA